jgi:hypothetical protein
VHYKTRLFVENQNLRDKPRENSSRASEFVGSDTKNGREVLALAFFVIREKKED